uniref:Uncharacterized protein n=1 Tax=Leersia perrieri TaxID=77586 RepID=A0A0D9VWJ3_9ORYZ
MARSINNLVRAFVMAIMLVIFLAATSPAFCRAGVVAARPLMHDDGGAAAAAAAALQIGHDQQQAGGRRLVDVDESKAGGSSHSNHSNNPNNPP